MTPIDAQPDNLNAEMRFRILSLDGGGIRGAFSAAVLAELENATGCATAEFFDLIVGTSTGGIIALGVGLGLPAGRIQQFYAERGPSIFPSIGIARRVRSSIKHLLLPKRSLDSLATELRAVFGDHRLGESKCRLVIPTYDAVTGRVFLLKTAHHERFTGEHKSLMVECALATAAAPTYFKAAKFSLHPGARYIDGGVWANCPAMVAVVEAAHFMKVDLSNIDLLSIGTTASPFSISPGVRASGGIFGWSKQIMELLMRGQAETALSQAQLLVGSVHRIDAIAEPGRFKLDDPRNIDDLIGLGFKEARKAEHLDIIKSRFLNGTPARPFVPFHST